MKFCSGNSSSTRLCSPSAGGALLNTLTHDGRLLFLTRFIRLFAYGALSVVLVFYLTGIGLSQSQTGLLLTLTLAGDTAVSLFLTTRADRAGRRRILIIGAVLMAGAGLTFASTHNFMLLMIAGTIGVLSPSGNEVGPFLSIEQAALAQVLPPQMRTHAFGWYTLAGSFATAIGSLCGGILADALKVPAWAPIGRYRGVIVLYAVLGLLLAFTFTRLSPAVEVERSAFRVVIPTFFGIDRSRDIVLRLSASVITS
jgi:MFS family permease